MIGVNIFCMRPFVLALAFLVLAGLIQGCASNLVRDPVPEALVEEAGIPDIPNARFWGDGISPALEWEIEQMRAHMRSGEADPVASGAIDSDVLAISGGGENGAFGAGLLVGWTETGTRPEFRVVTGVSTGALSAPFAFLGQKYDTELKEIYTTVTARDVIRQRNVFGIIFRDAIDDSRPLQALIAEYIDEAMLREIAAQYRRARMLYIGTTNLDAQRPVIWNIGAIAASGQPGALDLVRQVLLASASIPGAFPPVYISVEANGQRFDEMHVDGGTTTQVFDYPIGLKLREIDEALGRQVNRRLYIIRNSRLKPEWEFIKPRFLPIALRSISTLIKTQGIGDLYRMYLGARRDGMDYNLAYIPGDFTVPLNEPFDQAYMQALFDFAYRRAVRGFPWSKSPPGFEEVAAP